MPATQPQAPPTREGELAKLKARHQKAVDECNCVWNVLDAMPAEVIEAISLKHASDKYVSIHFGRDGRNGREAMPSFDVRPWPIIEGESAQLGRLDIRYRATKRGTDGSVIDRCDFNLSGCAVRTLRHEHGEAQLNTPIRWSALDHTRPNRFTLTWTEVVGIGEDQQVTVGALAEYLTVKPESNEGAV